MTQVGRVVGARYELGGLLGRGHSVEVRKATDLRIGRTVAVKMLHGDDITEGQFESFRREAQIAASLNHPAIAAVYDTGEDVEHLPDGSERVAPYIVMEYVAGRTLQSLLREGRKILDLRALEIAGGILAALEYVHRAGFVHRNIKPANVMITPRGDVKVIDFGIALVRDEESNGGTDAPVVGTAQYMAPEQARGERVDGRADVYSVGCLLFELLTGRPPFVGDSPLAIAFQQVRESPPAPSEFELDLADGIDDIVSKSLAKSPDERYPSAAAMRADIERLLAVQLPAADAEARPDDAPPRVGRRETGEAIDTIDGVAEEDLIGRGALIDHFGEVVHRMLAAIGHGGPTTMVVGVDAAWGSGKTTFVHLATRGMDDLRPVIVPFDAWRESQVGPEWWSFGAHLYRAIRGQRSWPARTAMVAVTTAARLRRSTTLLATTTLLGLLGFAVVKLLPARLLDDIGSAVAVILGSLAAALALSRLLFWASPSLGTLYQRTEDASLDDIAVTIATLRRWVPPPGRSALAENLLALWLLLVGASVALDALGIASSAPSAAFSAVLATVSLVLLCAVIGVDAIQRRDRDRTAGRRLRDTVARLRGALWPAAGYACLVVAFAGVAGWWGPVARALGSGAGDVREVLTGPGVVGPVLLTVAGLAAYAAYDWRWRNAGRRPVVMVIDDLDRCSAEKTVSYLETVHTILRPSAPGVVSRRLAPLVIVVVADSRWVRDAFETAYEGFDANAGGTARIGDRFIQKLFDHRILVPELTEGQSREYLRVLTGSDYSADSPLPDEGPTTDGSTADHADQAADEVAHLGPSELSAVELAARDSDDPMDAARVEAIVAERSTEEYEHFLNAHLMTRYTAYLPRNPRSIKKVANAWSMLQALQVTIGGTRHEAELVAAAILMVEFPSLLDDLRDGRVVEDGPAWSAPGVVRVRSITGDEPISISALAACFGWRCSVEAAQESLPDASPS